MILGYIPTHLRVLTRTISQFGNNSSRILGLNLISFMLRGAGEHYLLISASSQQFSDLKYYIYILEEQKEMIHNYCVIFQIKNIFLIKIFIVYLVPLIIKNSSV